MLGFIPDGRYELVSFATDEKGRNVSAYAIFRGTHTGQGGPVPPTGKSVATDYVYVMQFDGDAMGMGAEPSGCTAPVAIACAVVVNLANSDGVSHPSLE